jgi:hypothetical protein
MRKLFIGVLVLSVTAVGTAPAIAGAPARTDLTARLITTSLAGLPAEEVQLEPGDDPGSNWVTGNGIWHVRNLPATDILESLDGLTEIGHVERVFHFNLDLNDGSSTARCAFTLTLTDPDLGTFLGHCAGSLDAGTFTANGVDKPGHLSGVYELEAGAVSGAGPLIVKLTVIHR